MKSEYYYQKYLKSELSERINKNYRYSMRSFAKTITVDPGDLSRILNGTKILTPAIAKKIISKLSFSTDDKEKFLSSVAEAYEKQGVKRKSFAVKSIIRKSKLKAISEDLTAEKFRIISDWHYFAILQIIKVEGFIHDTKWISKHLNIPELEAKMALQRLLSLRLIKNDSGKLIRTNEVITAGDTAFTSSAHQKRIKQITEKSIFSLENDPISLRNHSTMTISIDPEKISLAKEMIQHFMDDLEKVLETKKKTVYELQINLFPLQRSSLNETK
ncbi:MAG: TIGR02147 family protein [Bacteriovoracaceae bacterium]|nr:TIGR02147 family protein [Bacteriovoracaceae bacterium]